MSSLHEIAPDDVVATHEAAEGNDREPLLVMDPLKAFLDAKGSARGRGGDAPVGEGHSNVTYAMRRGDGSASCCAAHHAARCRRARTTCCVRRACWAWATPVVRAPACWRRATTSRSSARRST